MVPEVRFSMNKRFIEVFNLLVEKKIIVMNDRGGKGIGDFANDILGKPYSHIIRAFLSDSDKRCIDYHHVDKLFLYLLHLNNLQLLDKEQIY